MFESRNGGSADLLRAILNVVDSLNIIRLSRYSQTTT